MTYALTSFDVWDTLLRRNCHPEHIKLEMAAFLVKRLNLKLSARRVYRMRLAIEAVLGEHAARKGRSRDCDFIEVHTLLLKRLGQDSTNWTLLDELLEQEVKLEIHHSYVDETGLALLKNAKENSQRVVFISDFYMPKAWLMRILAAKGLTPYLDGGYVSIDHGHTKHDGSLFEHVRAAEHLEASAWLHYGDNAHSDVTQAERCRIDAVHFLPPTEHALRLDKEAAFLSQHRLTGWERLWLRIERRLRAVPVCD